MTDAEKSRGWSPFDRALLSLMRATPLGRGAARRVLGALLRSRVGSAPLDVCVKGLNARLSFDNVPEIKALLRPGGRDAVEAAFLAEALPLDGGGLLVDIGANAGVFALAVLAARPSADVIAIEPNPAMVARLRLNLVTLNSTLTGRRQIIEAAVAAKDGALSLDTGGGAGTASIVASGNASTINVRGAPLAKLLDEAGARRIHAMKIDIEGFEDVAMPPFFETAQDTLLPDRICIEKPDGRSGATERCLALRGYRDVRRTHGNVLYVRDAARRR